VRAIAAGLGGSLRAGVFGVNDGLVSNASLVPVSRARRGRGYVLTTGWRDARRPLSMAAGEYVSVR